MELVVMAKKDTFCHTAFLDEIKDRLHFKCNFDPGTKSFSLVV